MIGIIPSSSKTFEVFGMFNDPAPVEGKLYINSAENGRVYMFSVIEKRPNPNTGWFPIWDGNKTCTSKFANKKYLDQDVIKIDLSKLAGDISKDVANQILDQYRRCEDDEVLEPQISDKDNMFTQCIKGVILTEKLSLMDLVDRCSPRLSEKVISNYYDALTRIAFMRTEKWDVWTDVILHISYIIMVYKEDRMILTYDHRDKSFDTGIVRYDDIAKGTDDPLKKIIKILMIMENISKDTLKSREVDDHTINNMMTTLNGPKALSSQLFSRFIRLAHLSYEIDILKKDDVIFEFRE